MSCPLTRTFLKVRIQHGFTFDLEAYTRGVVGCHPVAGPRCLLYLWIVCCAMPPRMLSVCCSLPSRNPTFRRLARKLDTDHPKKLGQATSGLKTEIAASIQTAFRDGLKALPKSTEFVDAVVNVVKNKLFENAVKTAVSKKSPANCPSKRVLDDAVKDNGATVDAIINKSLAPKLSAAVKVKPVWSCVGFLCSSSTFWSGGVRSER